MSWHGPLLLTRHDWKSWGTRWYRGSKGLCHQWHAWDREVFYLEHEQITRHGVSSRRWSSLTLYTGACQTYLCRNGKKSKEWKSLRIIEELEELTGIRVNFGKTVLYCPNEEVYNIARKMFNNIIEIKQRHSVFFISGVAHCFWVLFWEDR